jgi:hypothetical protein
MNVERVAGAVSLAALELELAAAFGSPGSERWALVGSPGLAAVSIFSSAIDAAAVRGLLEAHVSPAGAARRLDAARAAAAAIGAVAAQRSRQHESDLADLELEIGRLPPAQRPALLKIVDLLKG